MVFASHTDIADSDRSNGDSLFEYWKNTCAVSKEWHPSQIRFTKRDAGLCVVDLDDLAANIESGTLRAESGFLAPIAVSHDDLDMLMDEIGALYQLSVIRWTLSMEKIRL
jgi:hypothetical protein